MQKSNYRMSFSTGGLYLNESVEITQLYLVEQDWNIVRDQVMSRNILQTRTNSSSKRAITEIFSRLQTLSKAELALLSGGSRQEQRHLLWLAVCRTYPFIHDFALEVLREHFLNMRLHIEPDEFDYFYNKKADMHEQLDELSDSTREKLRQVLFKIMREAEVVTPDNVINPVLFTADFVSTVAKNSAQDLTLFPVYEADVRNMAL